MAYQYTYIDGQRVEVNVAADFKAMAAEFARVWGLTLHVRSGTRTRAEQQYLYNGWINRLPGFNLAAKPGTSNHEEDGPIGPRALDLYDSGNNAGVTTVGTARNNWIRDNGPRWGFTLAGLTFNPKEGWHIEYTRALAGQGSPAGSGQWPANARYGSDWVKSAQQKLTLLGLYSGDIDGLDGPQSQTATKTLQAALGVDQDGIYGPVTNEGADLILAGHNQTQRPVVDIQRIVDASPDNQWGPKTSFQVYKWQKANGLTADAIWGAISDAKAFPPAPTEPSKSYPTNGRNITARPTKDIQNFLIGKNFLAAGEDDGDYGPKTSVAAAMFQESVGLEVDGIWGNNTDAKAFPGVPVPEQETAKPRTPVLPFAAAGWDVPLGQTKRDDNSIITTYIIHHETAFTSQVPYFKTKNDRGSCPTWEVNGKVITEMIHPAMRPSATGKANTYSVASETVNTSGEPDWKVSDDSIESHAQIAAWLSQQTEFTAPDGTVYRVRVTLDRQHIIGHNEAGVNATACPGPFQTSKLDYIVARAKEIVAEQNPEPEPEPEDDLNDQIKAKAAELDALIAKLP